MLERKLRGHVIAHAEWDGESLTHVCLSNGERIEVPPINALSVDDVRAIVWAGMFSKDDFGASINRWAQSFSVPS